MELSGECRANPMFILFPVRFGSVVLCIARLCVTDVRAIIIASLGATDIILDHGPRSMITLLGMVS